LWQPLPLPLLRRRPPCRRPCPLPAPTPSSRSSLAPTSTSSPSPSLPAASFPGRRELPLPAGANGRCGMRVTAGSAARASSISFPQGESFAQGERQSCWRQSNGPKARKLPAPKPTTRRLPKLLPSPEAKSSFT
jgi:hypothetical protein